MRIGTYYNADALLGDESNRTLPGKSTYLVQVTDPLSKQEDDAIAVNYAGTKVVIFRSNGDVIYYHGGWQTATTISRMNTLGREDVEVSKKGPDFFVRVGGGEPVRWDGFAVIVTKAGEVRQLATAKF